MAGHRVLATWAEREQRRFDQQKANPGVPGTESTGRRILQGFLGTFAMVVKGVILPLYLVWTVALIAQHTLQSLILAVALMMLFSITAFTTALLVHARRQGGLNWVTGLGPKAESN